MHDGSRAVIRLRYLMALLPPVILSWAAIAIFPATTTAASCPNEALRTGPSAALPDCRAYELLSPPDANGRLLEGISTFGFALPPDVFPTELISPSGSSFLYMTYNSPLLVPEEPSGTFDLYETRRLPIGWQTTRRLSPSGAQAVLPYPGGASSEHAYAFTAAEQIQGGTHPAGSLAAEGNALYLSNPDGSFELVGVGSLGSERLAQGRYISNGGEHIIFTTGRLQTQSIWCNGAGLKCPVVQLEPDAPPTGTGAVYDRPADGSTHVISLLPGNKTPTAGEEAFYQGASADGSAVAFTIKGTLYVRVDDAQTLEVPTAKATYAGFSNDGSRLIYVSGGNIHRFDTTSEEDQQINSSNDAEIVNVSADGSHVYFISPSQLDGAKGTVGQPNLYVWSGGPPEYVATVLSSDLEGLPALTKWTDRVVAPMTGKAQGPGNDPSRSTSDGTILILESRAQLTPYDNSGHTEVYRYNNVDKSLRCVSCNPTSEPATKDARLQELQLVRPAIVIHNVSSDGSRVFFETPEALVTEDSDGINDIYEWQEEEGGGTEVNLISSGQSVEYQPLIEEPQYLPRPNILLSTSPEGEDVVFLAQEALAQDVGIGGMPAIYDAKVGGGFTSVAPPTPCVEEGCRPAASNPPGLAEPLSETIQGSGNINVKPRKKKRCHRIRRFSKHRHSRRCPRHRPNAQAGLSAATTIPPDEGASSAAEDDGAFAVKASVLTQRGASPVTAPAEAEFEFGIESVGAEASMTAAGVHPDFTASFALDHFINKEIGVAESEARTQEVSVSLPPGLLGNPTAIPHCSTGQLLAFGNCPIDSQVGIAKLLLSNFGKATEPIYNMEPPHPEDEVARFGFFGGLYPVFIDIKVRTATDFGVTATVHSAPAQVSVIEAKTTLWGNPADPSHDKQRLTAQEAVECTSGTACKAPEGKRPSDLPPTVFMTNPSACQQGEVEFSFKVYQLPDQAFSASAPMAPIQECEGLPFAPSFKAVPTNPVAGAPTGLKTTLTLPQIEDVESKGTSTMREARVTLPEGMTIAAGAADGLEACSAAQVGLQEEVDAACPDASKLGAVTIISPALPEPLHGALYQRTPEPGHLFRLWLVTDELGLHVKLPGEIKADPATGQLTAVFSDLPQVPVEQIILDVWGGPRAPLKNPDSCGTYATTYTFTPHSNDPSVSSQSQMTIDQGCNSDGFSPTLHAGVTNPVAGAFSPLIVDIAQQDSEQNLRALTITLPKGELAKLAGVSLCSDTLAATGSCPESSKIGFLTVAVGPGPAPLWLPQPGKSPTAVYLAGPYKGAPFSVVTVVPAQAGPFNLGNVVVRSALDVDPETARATVNTDPLPQFIEGVPAIYRRVHAVVDRPDFSLNPTNCSELQTTSVITSAKGAAATPSSRFQVDGCKTLAFKPKLTLDLKGGTKRGDYPALIATVNPRLGDANIREVSAALPHSEFLAQEHIVTICTRVRFAAKTCPKGSIYGKAKAFTPLLDQPLEGPVYLRSSNNPLPDLVVALGGQLDIDLVGRIDSHNGGIRTTFSEVPDAPVTKFILTMRGGAKGLLVNSRNICRDRNRATVKMRAQNGRTQNSRPMLRNSACPNK